MSFIPSIYQRNQQATIYVGNLDQKVNQTLIWELFTQCGPVVNVHIPRDKITNQHQGYGFIEFKSQEDADYSIKIMHMVKLFGKPIKVNKASQDKRTQQVGANLFIGNLDPDVDQKMLYQTFSNFGMIISTKIMRDAQTGSSKGYGFVSYDNFEASDQAINVMNGQHFSGKQINVQYAYKKQSKGQRHGSAAGNYKQIERLLAANRPNSSKYPSLLSSNKNQTVNLNLPQSILKKGNSIGTISILNQNSTPLSSTMAPPLIKAGSNVNLDTKQLQKLKIPIPPIPNIPLPQPQKK